MLESPGWLLRLPITGLGRRKLISRGRSLVVLYSDKNLHQQMRTQTFCADAVHNSLILIPCVPRGVIQCPSFSPVAMTKRSDQKQLWDCFISAHSSRSQSIIMRESRQEPGTAGHICSQEQKEHRCMCGQLFNVASLLWCFQDLGNVIHSGLCLSASVSMIKTIPHSCPQDNPT